MMSNVEQEQAIPLMHPNMWHHRRNPRTTSVFDDEGGLAVHQDIFSEETDDRLEGINRHRDNFGGKKAASCSSAVPQTCGNLDSDGESIDEFVQEQIQQAIEETSSSPPSSSTPIHLDASSLGDIPARYTISPLEAHQLPVIGVYVDPRVVPGFKYRVRPLDPWWHQLESPGKRRVSGLFRDRALVLSSIGRGYARRFTFEADPDKLKDNDNYFWSDSNPDGYAFELEVVSVGDKFTVFDMNHVAQGTLEVVETETPQIETYSATLNDRIEKKVKVSILVKVEFYESGVAKPQPLTGIAVCVKGKGAKRATIAKVANVSIGRLHKGFYLLPGVQKDLRRVTVRGEDVGDVPTKYTLVGLEPYEHPVVGTYVDPRVVPGFWYKVRPALSKQHLFKGRSMRLCSIGMGYAKRLSFQPDSLAEPDNYLWSDNHPDGLGLEPRAVHTGMRFNIFADGQRLGQASVFRADKPQREERQEMVEYSNGKCAIVKHIHVEVTCHVRLAKTGGGSVDSEDHLMRVYGLAIVRKEPNQQEAKIVRLENVGLDSQLNILFAQNHTELVFKPL